MKPCCFSSSDGPLKKESSVPTMGSSDDGMKRARAISERVVLVPERVDRVKKTFSFRNLGVLVGLGVFDGVGVMVYSSSCRFSRCL